MKFLWLIILITTGCQAAVRQWQKVRLTSHLEQLKSYHGVLRERGALSTHEDLVSEIWFEHPMKYYVKVLSPAAYSGSLMIYNGPNLYFYFPKSKFGILYRNLPQLTTDELKTLIARQFDDNMNRYQYELGDAGKILTYKVIELKFGAKDSSAIIHGGRNLIYDEFSFPLSGELALKDNLHYSYSFDSIEFNKPISDDRFNFDNYKADILSEWDFGQPSLEQAKTQANFPFHLPKYIPQKFALSKILRQKGEVPAFMSVFESRPFFIYVTSYKDYGLNLVPTGRGIPLNGNLIINPHLSSYSFSRKGVQYTLSGNVSVEELVKMGDSL